MAMTMGTRVQRCFQLLLAENGNIGAITDEKLTITRIIEGSAADGILLPGDKIVRINDTEVFSQVHLASLLLSSGPTVRLIVMRDSDSELRHTKEAKRRNDKSASKPSDFIEPGCSSKEVTICLDSKTRRKLGLGIKDCCRMVIVSRTDPDSVSADLLKEGDTIVEIEGHKTRNKDDARSLLLNSLKKKGKVTLKILRAESKEMQKYVSDRVDGSKSDRSTNQPSVVMKSDVVEIAQRERRRLLERNNPSPLRGILSQRRSPSPLRAAIDIRHQSTYIGKDDSDCDRQRNVHTKMHHPIGELFPLI
uniref:PDZ domain-containing protein n=1 Tax=Parascaris univalens TaxID=6257 RepID=A0A915B7V2_PARUN